MIVTYITNIKNLCNKIIDSLLINKINIQIAEGNISIIKRQINNEVYERLLIVKNYTYLQENISIITKQYN